MITLSPCFSPPISAALVAVIDKATAKSALTSGSTRLEFVREVPLPIKPTITRVLVMMSILGVLVSVSTHRERSLGCQRADVGRPGRHLVAISSDTQYGNGGRGGGAWAGWVARCREAWRGAR